MAWLTDVLERIVSASTKASDLQTLLPWNWAAAQAASNPPANAAYYELRVERCARQALKIADRLEGDRVHSLNEITTTE